jgi:hypothetical protein
MESGQALPVSQGLRPVEWGRSITCKRIMGVEIVCTIERLYHMDSEPTRIGSAYHSRYAFPGVQPLNCAHLLITPSWEDLGNSMAGHPGESIRILKIGLTLFCLGNGSRSQMTGECL